ncbi:MAG: hypothetical protein ACOZF2_12180, partial [Thermodesulfobacteriota bacterium]
METIAAHPENQGKFYLQIILSYFLILALCCFYLLVCSTVPGYALDYYVDSNDGDDNYDGRSPSWNGTSGPWRTLRKVYLMSSPSSSPRIQGGDVVYLKRGSTFRGNTLTDYPRNITAALALQCSGSPNSYITIMAYPDPGPGEDPIKDKPVILGNGLTCAICLDQSYVTIKNIAITYNNVITPVLSLLLLDDPPQTASASTSAAPASAASTSATITSTPLPPPSLASSRFRHTKPNCRQSDTPILPPPDLEVLQELPAPGSDLPLTFIPLPPSLPAHYAIPPFPASSTLSATPPPLEVISPSVMESTFSSSVIPDLASLPDDDNIQPRHGGTKGKGIIIPNSKTDTSPGPNNIMIQDCDIYWCPLSGISIENSGVIWIKGAWHVVNNQIVSTSNICGNGESGIEIIPYTYEENGQNKKNKCNITNINISGCDIYENYFHGVYLESAGNPVTCNGNPSDP